jgi:site-specific DNA-methyltransferase (adenine-specific)
MPYSFRTYEEWKNWTDSVWYIQAAQSVRNLAVFPEELVERIIKLYSFPGDTVLDPFAGTGTTLIVAKKLGRKAVGYEINKELQPIIKQKLVS